MRQEERQNPPAIGEVVDGGKRAQRKIFGGLVCPHCRTGSSPQPTIDESASTHRSSRIPCNALRQALDTSTSETSACKGIGRSIPQRGATKIGSTRCVTRKEGGGGGGGGVGGGTGGGGRGGEGATAKGSRLAKSSTIAMRLSMILGSEDRSISYTALAASLISSGESSSPPPTASPAVGL